MNEQERHAAARILDGFDCGTQQYLGSAQAYDALMSGVKKRMEIDAASTSPTPKPAQSEQDALRASLKEMLNQLKTAPETPEVLLLISRIQNALSHDELDVRECQGFCVQVLGHLKDAIESM